MTSADNPFRAPTAPVLDYNEASGGSFLPEGRRVAAGRGYQWLLDPQRFDLQPTLRELVRYLDTAVRAPSTKRRRSAS